MYHHFKSWVIENYGSCEYNSLTTEQIQQILREDASQNYDSEHHDAIDYVHD